MSIGRDFFIVGRRDGSMVDLFNFSYPVVVTIWDSWSIWPDDKQQFELKQNYGTVVVHTLLFLKMIIFEYHPRMHMYLHNWLNM